MWMEKLSYGVLRVLTPLGPRYIRLSFPQRVYLVWIFRHFGTLPQQVLSRRQQRLVDRLCTSQEFVSLLYGDGFEEVPIIGTVERRPAVPVEEPARIPTVVRVTERTSLAELQQRT